MHYHRDKCPEDGTNPQDKPYQPVINPVFRLLSFRGGGRGLLVRREENRWRGCGPSGGGRGVCGTVLLNHMYISIIQTKKNSCLNEIRWFF